MSYVVVAAVFAYVAFLTLRTVLQRFLVVPPARWRGKLQTVLSHEKNVYLSTGAKRLAYRRRLILASQEPSFYNNYTNNKVKIAPIDKANGDLFTAKMAHRDTRDPERRIIHGFFHPYANNGGGGERVLWQAVQATLEADQRHVVAVYTTNVDAEPAHILAKARDKFHISVDGTRVVFVYMRRFEHLIDAHYWRHFTLVGQLVGLALLALEALYELSPDVWIDTIGLPGSYLPVAWSLRVPILAYVHYPIIQQDMFNKLRYPSWKQLGSFRPTPRDAKDAAKLAYWLTLYFFYRYLGSLVDVTLTNGSWTYNHLKTIWGWKKSTRTMEVLYPPCGTEDLALGSDMESSRANCMLYIAQYRPEKRHSLILHEYRAFLGVFRAQKTPLGQLPTVRFLGSCRTPDDTATLESLRRLVEDLELQDYVTFIVDCLYEEILHQLLVVTYGLNAMWNEHFGIGVVEYLSRGVIPIVHASAGPLLDIVTGSELQKKWHNESGFFFKSELDPDYVEENTKDGFLQFDDVYYPTFARCLEELFMREPQLVEETRLAQMRKYGALAVLQKFSNRAFLERWIKYSEQLNEMERELRGNRDPVEEVY